MLPVTENTNLKIIIDTFSGNYYVKLGGIYRYNAFLVNKEAGTNTIAIVLNFNFMIFENDNSRNPLFNKSFPIIIFSIGITKNEIYIQLNGESINITNEGINFRLLFRRDSNTIIMEYANPNWWRTFQDNLKNNINTYIYLDQNQTEKLKDLATRLQ